MKPQETIKLMNNYLAEMQKAKRMSVAVGLPQERMRNLTYENGQDVPTVGMAHEFGAGVPQRSWLRATTEIKKKDIADFIAAEYEQVLYGKTATVTALDRIGAMVAAQIKQAFATNGFGQWPSLSTERAEYKDEHGRGQTLVFTGLLRNSVGWVVRNAT